MQTDVSYTLLIQLTHTHPFNSLFSVTTRWAGSRKVKPIWILLKQETVSGSGISWVICKSAPCSRQTTTPAPHYSVLYWPDALPAAQPTASKHWRLCWYNSASEYSPIHTCLFNDFFFRTTCVSRYQKGKTCLDEARDDGVLGWQWHQLHHMQIICTSLQTVNHNNTSSLNFYMPHALPDA